MSTYSTPFKSGTFNGQPNGTEFTVAGFTPEATDVGRLIVVTNGLAKLQHREITSVNGQDITVAHTWNSNPFLDPTSDLRMSDVLPNDGATVVISYDMDDLIATDTDIAQDDNNHLVITGNWIVSGGAYIHIKNYHVELTSRNISISDSSGIIFGYYTHVPDQDAFVKDACHLVELTPSPAESWRPNGGDFGSLEIMGGSIYVPTGNPFWRCYEGNSVPNNVQVRIFGVNAYGSLGGRIDGNRSMLVLTNEGSNSVTGVFNPRDAVARVEFSVFNCDQGAYIFTTEGASGRAVFTRLVNVSTRLLRIVGNNRTGIYEVAAKKSEVDLVPAFLTRVPPYQIT